MNNFIGIRDIYGEIDLDISSKCHGLNLQFILDQIFGKESQPVSRYSMNAAHFAILDDNLEVFRFILKTGIRLERLMFFDSLHSEVKEIPFDGIIFCLKVSAITKSTKILNYILTNKQPFDFVIDALKFLGEVISIGAQNLLISNSTF